MTWWFSLPSRAKLEKAAIADLAEQVDWLEAIEWSPDKQLRLSVSFTLLYADKRMELVMSYPAVFPDIPPQIRPKDPIRLSGHQYGASGELCLEFRPDNWDSRITGAIMIKSAHRLLAGEAQVDGEAREVPNAHRTTIGQDVRNQHFRLLLTDEAMTALRVVQADIAHDLEILEHMRASRWIAQIDKVGDDGSVLQAGAQPPGWVRRKGTYLRLSDGATIPSSLSDVLSLVRDKSHHGIAESIEADAAEYPLLLERGGEFFLRTAVTLSGERQILAYKTVKAPSNSERLPPSSGALHGKKVGIVGCGSIGSKIGVALARSGVEQFVLVDGDVFFEGNLVRNELDRRAIGLNKPDALNASILEINPAVEITPYRVNLGGQESSAFLEGVITALRNCDALIDATAEPVPFNILGGIAQRGNKPFLFAEVFGGGIGGLVTRLRPGIEPVPSAAKEQIENWCQNTGLEPPRVSSRGYETESAGDSQPLIADDAAVTIMAAHLTSMAIDALANDGPSRFPHPAYMIGLDAGWIFAAPFEVWPIDLVSEGDWGTPTEEKREEILQVFIEDLMKEMAETQSSPDED